MDRLIEAVWKSFQGAHRQATLFGRRGAAFCRVDKSVGSRVQARDPPRIATPNQKSGRGNAAAAPCTEELDMTLTLRQVFGRDKTEVCREDS
ncbi:hypothetical protein N7539_003308 [Penicillium diatomitis]|uniref:Uncharacterized protein n=1 Tax=Penicillium diatomitis TaxID=2819901 RepID=A0A9X0BZJ5_9EURO|nr:uncharacterized protein N7539_003308 [Penicillium diatomitis]KAJ5491741.1 hypothetical protein N7539_003308 [Penicillium diatomitis]